MVDDMNLTSAPGMLGTDPELHLKGNVWYSYVHNDSTLHTKRYFDWGDYKEVGDSTFVCHVTILYEAEDREAACDEGVRLITAHFRG